MVRTVTELDGTWLFRPDPRRIGELYPEELHYTHAYQARWCEPDHGVSSWVSITVPGLWTRQGHPDLECGWYRLDFASEPCDGIAALIFEGVDYYADVWLNGHYLGSHEGCFGHFDFEIGDLLVDRNTLVVRVDSPPDVSGVRHEIGQMKRMFRGALERWDMNDPESKPAGIFGSVRLERSGQVRVQGVSVEANPVTLPPAAATDMPVSVEGHLTAQLRIAAAVDAVIRYRIEPIGFAAAATEGQVSFRCAPGTRSLSLEFVLDQAQLWWTWDLGNPRLYEVNVEIWVDDEVHDRLSLTTGFRRVHLENGWDLRLNGVPLYQRGANYLSDLDLSSMTAERYKADLALMRGANLNTAHPFAVVERDEFYAACDAAGIIVYQDFPIWMMSDPGSEVVRGAIRQFDAMLDRLRNHPSLAIWNFGSQPSVANFEKLCVALVRHARQRDSARIAHHANSAISYSACDDLHPLRSFFWKEERARNFEARYGWRRDCHMYPGWYFGRTVDIARLPDSHFGLVTEFGAQSLPRSATPALDGGEDTDPIPWHVLAAKGAQPALLQKHHPDARSLSQLVDGSQRHQAEVLRHHAEFIRRRKLSGGNGLHVFAFNDCWPAVSWSILEYDRTPKAAYAAVRQAMEPVQVFLDNYWDINEADELPTAVTIINDTPVVLSNARLEVVVEGLQSPGAITLPDVPASGGLRAAVPRPLQPGPQTIVLLLTWGQEQSVSNTYVIVGMAS
ncbi:glycoside hydrolase family 2 protein [Chelatococcus asaccharovorans]|uniref:beta-mannosidase n=1 Tax=Chelatococcus asaccharovorans TaxID=28210 RepID=A0A2V3TV75_9HYPH|nr:glycoside hydrolase family 2 TIM barrel-domain containing protein [Chelatococcus asaccharovorans]MBS7702042.1 hypothetical protein [Chelatococcus asaccharovorans]PXW52812.1 beta-mannosidase [Chelatococcus asaccharovorans]